MRKYWKEKNRYIAEKEKSADAGIKRMMLTSVLGMLICVVCLAGTTWAWFTANSGIDDTAKPLSVETAQVEVAVSIDNQGIGTVSGGNTQTIEIAKNKKLSVTLTGNGTSTKKYCYVEVDGGRYCVDLSSSKPITFTVCSSSGSMMIKASWSVPGSGISLISSGATIGKGEVLENDSENNSSGGEDVVNNGGSTEDNSSKKSEQGNTDGKVTENGNNNGSGSEPDSGELETQGESEE